MSVEGYPDGFAVGVIGCGVDVGIGEINWSSAFPEPARSKIRAISDAADAAHAQLRDVIEKQAELRTEAADLRNRLLRITDLHGPSAPNENHPEVRRLRGRIRENNEDSARSKTVYGRYSEVWKSLRQIHSAIERFARDSGANRIELASREVACKLQSGENASQAVERCRARQRELLADLKRIQSAPRPSSWCRDEAVKQIDKLAEAGRPDVFGLVESGLPIRWSQQEPVVFRGVGAGEVVPSATCLFAWTFRDVLITAIFREIAARADDSHALNDQQRATQVARLEAEILTLERQECAFVEQTNGVVPYRPDTDIRALLNLSDRTPNAKAQQ